MYYNRFIAAGNMTRDPQHKLIGQNSKVSFGIAINRKFRDRGGADREDVTFLDCEAWGKLADVLQKYGAKGKSLLVEGRIAMDRWTDQQGNNRSRVYVLVEAFQFAGPPTGGQRQDQSQQDDGGWIPENDEVPF